MDMSGCAAGDHPICVALLIEDAEQREAAVRQAIRNTLLSPEEESRDKAWRILSESVWKRNLYPYLDLIDAFARLAQKNQNVAELADRIEVLSGPRQRRIELLAPAIVSGSARLPRGTGLLRTHAMLYAAGQGLNEFLPAVKEYLAVLEPERIRARRLLSVPALFELCEGTPSGWDAPVVAFRRILDTDERTLENRFADDEGFREAFFSLADRTRHEVRAQKESESRSLLRRIVSRQLEYRGTAPSSPMALGDNTDWLVRLQRWLSPY
ncbi:MAG TPA: hypothetical protein VFW15_03190 [Thermoanaerobaculia bacterium]|nr:hypothetical protein [Thermoanaerobaculia bacterium]